MVVRAVPKLHAFIVLAFAAATAPLGCSDAFEGCAASRTCPPSDDAGAGGESGTGTETGGVSGSSSGTSGAAGADDGGQSGTSGSGGSSAPGGEGGRDIEPPTVEAFTPSDGSSNVERDIEVTAELSEPIDEATVTETSVTLTGPDGEVTGTLSVDENVISFVPDRPLYLLGTYTFALDDTIADREGNTLEQSASAEFRVRDGRWSAITTPFGTTGRYMSGFARNGNGDVLIGGTQPAIRSGTMWAAIFAADERRWLPVDTMSPGQDVNAAGMSLDDDRRAVFAWYGQANRYGWFRFTESEGWTDAGALPNYPFVAVSSEGKATAVWTDEMVISERTLDLSTGSLDPVKPVDSAGYLSPQVVASLDRMAVFTARIDGSGYEISVAWQNAAGGWNAREPVATAPVVSQWRVRSDEQGNIVLLWVDFDETGDEMWSRVYERESAEWTRPQLVMPAPPYSGFGRPVMSSGNIAVTIYGGDMMWTGACYEKGSGWVQSSFVELDGLGDPGIYVELGIDIDRRGNVLTVGQTGYRRYVPGEGWQPIVQHGLDFDGIREVWLAAAPDGSKVAVTYALTANNENIIPLSVLFE